MHDIQQNYITLGQAAKSSPGRPSTNCMWRWARKGLRARSGEIVTLQHVRIGGKIFTTTTWVEEFGRLLALADADYFNRQRLASATQSVKPRDEARRAHIQNIDDELEEAGL